MPMNILLSLTDRDWSLRTETNIITFQARIGLKLTGRNKFGKIHEVSKSIKMAHYGLVYIIRNNTHPANVFKVGMTNRMIQGTKL